MNKRKYNEIKIRKNYQAVQGRLCAIVVFAQNHAKGQSC